MALLDRKTECCGASFESDDISILGLTLISFPYIVIYWLLFPITLPWQILSRDDSLLYIILKANVEMIRKAHIFPQLKCQLSGKLYTISPILSGFVFQFFNLSCLFLFWTTIVGSISGVMYIWP